MINTKTNLHCCGVNKVERKWSTGSSLLTGILIALIPKCPYCILAYSSAITMCSGTKLYMQSPGVLSYLPLALAFLTLLFIVLNNRGKRTIAAAVLVGTGSLLMLACEFYSFNLSHYYIGTFLIFFGVWVNASFKYFFKKWFKPLLSRLSNNRV